MPEVEIEEEMMAGSSVSDEVGAAVTEEEGLELDKLFDMCIRM